MSDQDQNYSKLRLCINLRAGDILPSCGARGSRELANALEKALEDRDLPFTLETVHCMGKCHIGPAIQLMPRGPILVGLNSDNLDNLLELLEKRDFNRLEELYKEPEESVSLIGQTS